jgi:hypothetical protein
MSNRSKWILILVAVIGAAIVAWAGHGRLWKWLLALHGH